MANLTITVDDEILRRARVRALEQGTSVNAILAEHLERFARVLETQDEALRGLLQLASGSTAEDRRRAKLRGGRRWRREDLYDR